MRMVAVILCVAVIYLCSLPIFASSPIISGEISDNLPSAVHYGSDYFTIIITVLCLSALSLIALLIASAVMKKNK